MEYVVLGWPSDGPTLRLDYRRFSYAGKFVVSKTGKAVARERSASDGDSEYDDDVIAALSFDEDRTDPSTLRFRYVTVRRDRRGEGIGARLAAFGAARAGARGYDRVRIAVNNPFAYQALYRAGFGYVGERTGLAELVLERPSDRDPAAYREGLDAYRDRDLGDPEAAFLAEKRGADPPPVVDAPGETGG